jgi:hypothetical protein
MRFRKKPVEIEAIKFDGTWDSYDAVCRFMGLPGINDGGEPGLECKVEGEEEVLYPEITYIPRPVSLTIPTLEGDMEALVGDWIVRGVEGEFYPIKPSILEKTYEPIT